MQTDQALFVLFLFVFLCVEFSWKPNKIKIAPICEYVLSLACITHVSRCRCGRRRFVSCLCLCVPYFHCLLLLRFPLSTYILYAMYKISCACINSVHYAVLFGYVHCTMHVWLCAFFLFVWVCVCVYSSFLLWIVCCIHNMYVHYTPRRYSLPKVICKLLFSCKTAFNNCFDISLCQFVFTFQKQFSGKIWHIQRITFCFPLDLVICCLCFVVFHQILGIENLRSVISSCKSRKQM